MGYEVPLHEGPVMCLYCNVEANHVDSEVIYGKSFGYFYLCSNYPECDARVGATGIGRPVGTLAREPLRELRKQCHAKLDPLWRSGLLTRSETYVYLQKIMRLFEATDAHIGQFDEGRCRTFLMRIECQTCREHPGGYGPSHEGSPNCKSGSLRSGGQKSHCTCSLCF